MALESSAPFPRVRDWERVGATEVNVDRAPKNADPRKPFIFQRFLETVLKNGGKSTPRSSTSRCVARPSEFTEILRELGLRIQRARVTARLTQEQAASDSGIDYKRWQRLEEGSVNPTVKTLHRVAAALDVPFWDLFSPLQRRRSQDNIPRSSGKMPTGAEHRYSSGQIPVVRETNPPPSKRAKTRGE